MKRIFLSLALLGAVIFAGSSTAQAQYYYRRPGARVAARMALPPYRYARPWYGPGYYRTYPYYSRPYNYGFGPRTYGYGGYGGWGFGPGAYIGIGAF